MDGDEREVRKTLERCRQRAREKRLSPSGKKLIRRLEAWLLERKHGDGTVSTRRVKRLGIVRSVHRPGSQAEESEGWQVICGRHGSVISTDTRRMAESAASEADWCDDCQRHEQLIDAYGAAKRARQKMYVDDFGSVGWRMSAVLPPRGFHEPFFVVTPDGRVYGCHHDGPELLFGRFEKGKLKLLDVVEQNTEAAEKLWADSPRDAG